MSDTETKAPDPYKPVPYRVTPRFAQWFREERKRRFLSATGMMQELALNYIVSHPEAAPWPEEETPR